MWTGKGYERKRSCMVCFSTFSLHLAWQNWSKETNHPPLTLQMCTLLMTSNWLWCKLHCSWSLQWCSNHRKCSITWTAMYIVTATPTKNAKALEGCGITTTVYTNVCKILATVKIRNRLTAKHSVGLVSV
jgi:hypothetical protein